MTNICRNCAAWEEGKGDSPNRCRRHPPTIRIYNADSFEWLWPEIGSHSWCAEFIDPEAKTQSITINSEGMEPEMEAFMLKILESIQGNR